jgi:hypothetical protein
MRKLRLLAVGATSTFLLSGCSFSLPSVADEAPCEKLSAIFSDKAGELADGTLDLQALASSIQLDVISIAPEDFQTLLEKATEALRADPIGSGELTRVATQIGVRCALVGVNVDFPSPEELLPN